jgi:hypothetical protein
LDKNKDIDQYLEIRRGESEGEIENIFQYFNENQRELDCRESTVSLQTDS